MSSGYPSSSYTGGLEGFYIACVAGVKRGKGRGNLGARESVGRAREKGKERLQVRHCFLHFSCSDSECENSD